MNDSKVGLNRAQLLCHSKALGCTKQHFFLLKKLMRPNSPSISLGVSLKGSKRRSSSHFRFDQFYIIDFTKPSLGFIWPGSLNTCSGYFLVKTVADATVVGILRCSYHRCGLWRKGKAQPVVSKWPTGAPMAGARQNMRLQK